MTRVRGRLAAAAVAVTAVLTAGGCVPVNPVGGGGSLSPVESPSSFDIPLPIPPLAPSTVVDGVRVFSLEAQEGTSEIVPGVSTPTWGFNGDVLGPTLRATRGERVAVEVTNSIDEPTTVHWHGMHLPPDMDGGPHQMVEPGDTWRPTWQIDQPAATLWYHPHPHGRTEEHVYRGLAGMFLLDDDRASGLPDDYGVDDVPVIVQDKRLDDDGRLVLDSDGNEVGLLGSTIVTNGVAGAVHEVTTELVRLRLLNGSTARVYDFAFEDDRPFTHVGTDGGLLPTPYETDHVRLSPGERAEIVVSLAPGSETMLVSRAPDLGGVVAPFAVGANDEFPVLRLSAAPELAAAAPVPVAFEPLADDTVDADDAAVTRRFAIQDRSINGRTMDMDRIDETVRVGDTEIWEVTNLDLFPHNWHVHDVQFQVLDVEGDPPGPELGGRKDTVYLEPRRTYRLAMRFEDFADPDTPYMAHCHLLLHEDQGLMAQFVVTDDGRAGRVATTHHDH
ncbi:multicopper oxidase family protein [Cellulomonas fengjieae]|uniref:Multicopper oxidase domain-containing protein n=1 Tax=Cellulomonas fengjieae TaxID=2819978 RepID=A0ABS3SI95_9CELL|nr:multicopper oxidase domain-containing protein [Cellulomonas fengjieae]MBO3085471.1 multicopper oxidase domain-containing protein [Cellulomonas fengjieae]QVI64482.1 multicopper oxidase domain-containing protein [Cellulomonas fengjieae]